MDSPSSVVQLSRAVSAVDLNASLAAVKEKPDHVSRHTEKTTADKVSINPPYMLESTIDSASPDGLLTPPVPPYPPPPTPATLGKTLEQNDTNVSKELGHQPTEEANSDVEVVEKKKKKKKRSGKNKKPAPTGFEEYFADVPIRPDDYKTELDLYDLTREFKDRMQTCIQRYRACRKLDSVRSNVFSKYLALGGIETGIKQFTGGLDQDTLEESTANEIADIQATDFIRTYPHSTRFYDGSHNWIVDFEGVAKGFFSYRLEQHFPIDSEKQLQGYCAVIRNFLKYVLYHKVCPEYTEDVTAACKIVDLAEKELWAIQRLTGFLPGDFNVATSIIFGGRYSNTWDPRYREFEETDDESSLSTTVGLAHAKAELIFMTGITICGRGKYIDRIKDSELSIVKTEKKCFEVVEIQLPDLLTVEKFHSVGDLKGRTGRIKPLGIVKLKRWKKIGFEQEDLTDSDDEDKDQGPEFESFFLEDAVLRNLYVDLKLEVIIKELNFGLRFIDSFTGLFCSFFTYLPNEKMVGYKEPVSSNRPAPTENDLDVIDQDQEDFQDEDD